MAHLGAARAKPPKDGICFHCQQAAEKYLKALLQERGLPIARTHNLEALLSDSLAYYPSLRSLRRGLKFLTDYAVDARYPGKNANRRQMQAALRWAGRVRDACRALLGVRPPRRRQAP
jgi:HEPN domain-containing protein